MKNIGEVGVYENNNDEKNEKRSPGATFYYVSRMKEDKRYGEGI